MRKWILIDRYGNQHWRRFPSRQAAVEFAFANGGNWSITRE